jgi:predicted amino acid dehydrogenase
VFIADDAFTSELKAFAAANTDRLTIESEQTDRDATRLGFDLATVSAIVTIVTSAFYFGELGVKVARWLAKSRANKVIIQTPLKTVELVKSTNITKDEIVELLKTAYTTTE